MAELDELKIPKAMRQVADQVAAFERVYIPYIPALGPEGTAAAMESGVVPGEPG